MFLNIKLIKIFVVYVYYSLSYSGSSSSRFFLTLSNVIIRVSKYKYINELKLNEMIK